MTFADTKTQGREALDTVLSSYRIGPKLRRLRLRKKIGLVDLGRHTGLSASLLSQLENGKLVPTLPTLARIAMVFDVGLDHFFAERAGRKMFAIVRAGERVRFPERAGVPAPAYFFECLAYPVQAKSMQAYWAEFPRRKRAEFALHFHEGSEFLYLLEGTLELQFEGIEHVLKKGDAAFFDASEPHGYRGAGKRGASALVVTAPLRI